jgi:hypothetical protein
MKSPRCLFVPSVLTREPVTDFRDIWCGRFTVEIRPILLLFNFLQSLITS